MIFLNWFSFLSWMHSILDYLIVLSSVIPWLMDIHWHWISIFLLLLYFSRHSHWSWLILGCPNCPASLRALHWLVLFSGLQIFHARWIHSVHHHFPLRRYLFGWPFHSIRLKITSSYRIYQILRFFVITFLIALVIFNSIRDRNQMGLRPLFAFESLDKCFSVQSPDGCPILVYYTSCSIFGK